MSISEPIDEIMLHWEAARQQGRNLAPEELCAESPLLLDEVRRRMDAILAMEQILTGTQHNPHQTLLTMSDGVAPAPEHEPLPNIPGYEITRVVDQGGMGVVYAARQTALGRTVAIKMISGVRLKPKAVARFRVEAEAAARLQHPHIVQIFDVGQVHGRPYFSMEYVDGGSLAELLLRSPPAPRQAAELIETLARAVHAAHERGIVHRDLKPGNVLLTKAGTPKIADFGLAKRLDDDTPAPAVLERRATWLGSKRRKKDYIGPRTDVALGATCSMVHLAGRPFKPLDYAARRGPGADRAFAARTVHPARPRSHLPEMSGKSPRASLCQPTPPTICSGFSRWPANSTSAMRAGSGPAPQRQQRYL